jgi:hypothetical protein
MGRAKVVERGGLEGARLPAGGARGAGRGRLGFKSGRGRGGVRRERHSPAVSHSLPCLRPTVPLPPQRSRPNFDFNLSPHPPHGRRTAKLRSDHRHAPERKPP